VAPPERVVNRSTRADTLHEALLSTAPDRNRDPERIDKAPPLPILERPGGSPTSPDARWVDGYWEWDRQSNDFIWVTGIWRVPPPGKFWVNGYWRRDDRGWYRVAGFWCARKESPADLAPIDRTAPANNAPPDASTTRTVARPPFAPLDRAEGATLPAPLPLPRPPATSLPAPVATPATAPSPRVVAALSPGVATAPSFATPPPLVVLADQLAGQAAAFEQVFGRTARITPQGGAFLADAQRLRGDAMGLRRAITAAAPAIRTLIATATYVAIFMSSTRSR